MVGNRGSLHHPDPDPVPPLPDRLPRQAAHQGRFLRCPITFQVRRGVVGQSLESGQRSPIYAKVCLRLLSRPLVCICGPPRYMAHSRNTVMPRLFTGNSIKKEKSLSAAHETNDPLRGLVAAMEAATAETDKPRPVRKGGMRRRSPISRGPCSRKETRVERR